MKLMPQISLASSPPCIGRQRASEGLFPGKAEVNLLPKQVCLGEKLYCQTFSKMPESSG